MDAGKSQKESATEFLRMVVANQIREAYARFIGPGFRHHNPFFRGDAAALMAGMEENAVANPQKSLEVKMAIEEGDRVAVLSHVILQPGQPGFATVHVFRFENDRVVELWDLGQAVPADMANEFGMF